jgi:adenosine kinase
MFFGVQLQQVLPYCDIIIGNETEAEAWAEANGVPDKKDIHAVAKKIAVLPKANASRPRIVIITQGAQSTILANSAEPESTKTFPVSPLTDDEIVDTNGAGDAFAGGFLGAFVSGKSLDECVEVGHKLGGMCVGQVRILLQLSHTRSLLPPSEQVGPQYKWPKVDVL